MEYYTRFIFMKTTVVMNRFFLVFNCLVFFCSCHSMHAASLPPAVKIDSIVILKQKHEMAVYHHSKLLKTYKVALGIPQGAKQFQGDRRTPEGVYTIDNKNLYSAYHKSMHISYPSAKDRKLALACHKDPGGNIMIHGLPNGQGYIGAMHTLKDWTAGCIAVTDEEVDELFAHVGVGTTVNILP
jgi:murein L,D-transpeptidase YafK